MRKILLLIFALTATVSISACGGKSVLPDSGTPANVSSNSGTSADANAAGGEENGSDKDDASKATVVSFGNDYSSSNGLEFDIFKIVTSEKLRGVGVSDYYNANSGKNYVDVILNVTNNGNEYLYDDDIKAYFVSDDEKRYVDYLIVTEIDSYDSFERCNIAPLSTAKIHIGYEIPKSVKQGKGYVQFGDDLFVVEYDAEEEVSSTIPISLKQKIKIKDLASFKLLYTEYTKEILPSNTSDYYNYYRIDDPNNIYYAVYCSLSNISTTAINYEDMISIRAIFDGKYEYTGFMAVEEDNGTTLEEAYEIEPFETRKGIFIFEVPKKVKGMDVELYIYFYGNEYSYTK